MTQASNLKKNSSDSKNCLRSGNENVRVSCKEVDLNGDCSNKTLEKTESHQKGFSLPKSVKSKHWGSHKTAVFTSSAYKVNLEMNQQKDPQKETFEQKKLVHYIKEKFSWSLNGVKEEEQP